MNKIYKVIWSKAKHTYVVASEIAKGHTKGETTGRGLKRLAAALLVAAALMGPNFAWAEEAVTIKVEPASGESAAVEVYTKYGADKAISTNATNISTNATNINTNTTNINGLTTRVNALESSKTDTALHISSSGDLIVGTKEKQTVKDMEIRGKLTSGSISTGDITSTGDVTVAGKMAADGVTDETTKDGTYIKHNNTVGNNLVSLDKQVKANADAINEEARKRKYSVTNLEKADAAEAATREAADNELNERITNEANAIHDEIKAGDEKLDTRITNVKEYLETQTSENYVSKTDAAVQDAGVVKADKKIGENVTALGKGLYDETAARIGADAAQDKVIQAVNNNLVQSVTTINKNVADGFTALNQADAKEAEAREAKDNELNERITNEANAIHDEIKAGDKVLDDRITNVKEYLEKQTSDNYVSKADAAVQDGAVVKAANTIGENVTNLDAALAKETAARIGADAAQDKVIEQVNQNMVDGFNTINKNMADGFTALNNADLKEAQERAAADTALDDKITAETSARVAADTKLVEATNGGLSLDNDNVLQKTKTEISSTGEVTTSKEAATILILNKGAANQVKIDSEGVTVGTSSTQMDAEGFTAGGHDYDKAGAALMSDGRIKGANGAFTVDENGNVASKATITGETVTDGKGASMSNGTVTGKTLTDGKAAISNGNIKTNGGFIRTGGGNINTQGGALRTKGGNINAGSGTITGNKLTDGVASLQNGNLSTTGNINVHDIVATGNIKGNTITGTSLNTQGGDINGGAITGTTINGTTGTFGSLITTGNASVGGTLTTNGITNTGNTTTDSLTVKQGATVGGNLGVTGDITGKSLNVGTGAISGGQITGTGLDVGAGTIKTIGAVETGTLETTGNATIGGNLTVDKNLTVNGEFNAKTLSSKLDENNYTTINGGKTESMNLKMGKKAGEFQASGSTFDETGSNAWAKDDESIGKSSMTADKISQSLSDTGDNPKNAASRELSQNTANKYEITDSVVEGNQSNVENRTADTTDSQISFKDDSGKVLNKSYITQNLKKVLMGVEEGDNKTTIEQNANNITNTAKNGTITNDAGKLVNTASDTIANMAGNDITNTSTNGNIANTAANGTISNNAKNLTNTASENITNKAENGNISNIASNGTISNEAKTISNKATEALTNDAKTITNKASESVTTQIGDGSAVKSVMNGNGIANTATDKAITNDAATITNTGTTSVTNQVGNNKVLVDTTHVQSAFGDTIYTTWDKSGITNNATDKTVATNAKNIQNTATGDITNTAEKGTITNKAQNLVNDASGNMTTTVGGEMKTTVTGKVTEDYKSDLDTKVGGNQITAVTGDSSLTAENITNKATVKLSNSAADIENTATKSITDKVGDNVSRTMTTSQIKESVVDGANSNTSTKTGSKDMNIVTDGTSTSTLSQLANSVNTSLKEVKEVDGERKTTKSLSNVKTVSEDTTKITDTTSGAFSSSSQKADSITSTVKNENGSNVATDKALSSESKLTSGSSVIDVLKSLDDAANPAITSSVTDGTNNSEVKQTASEVATSAKDISNTATDKMTSQIGDGSKVKSEMTADGITNTAEGGTIYNKSKDILNEASGDIINWADGEIGNVATKITNITGDNTVTSDTNGTTFENKAYSKAIEEGSVTKTTISGNTLETGKATMDYAEVMKDLGVHGNATVDGNTTLGTDGNDTLTVNSTSTFKEKVTMEKDLNVKSEVLVNEGDKNQVRINTNGITVGLNSTVVDSEGVYVGGHTFEAAKAGMDKDGKLKAASGKFQVDTEGNVSAVSYTVKDTNIKIDNTGINAGGTKVTGLDPADISHAGSTDAVSGGQLYETNTRVSGLETRMGTVETRVDKLDNKIDKVGANAAAMANLHPLEFDEDSKWNIAAAVGSSGSETASAVGVFYRPNENVMVNASAAMGTGENMFGGGVSLRLGHGGNKAKEAQMKAAAAENKELRAKVDDLTARMDALLSVLNPNMSKDFPDVPENHWAYEAVSRLAGNGIVEGYEDGKYHGERQMTRYEMAEIIYNALSKGAKAEKKLVEEFRPELQAMAAQKKA